MKSFIATLVINIVLLLSFSVSATQITLAYSEIESFPFLMGNGSEVADPPGIVIDIITQAAQDIGVTVNFVRYPNKRVFYSLEKNLVDGVFAYSFKSERAVKGHYPMRNGQVNGEQRLTATSYYLYKNKNSSLHWDGKTISGLNGAIGANAGYSIVTDLKKMNIPVNEYYGSYETSKIFMLLQRNRIAGVAAQDLTTDPYLADARFNDIEKIPLPLKTKDYFLVFSHQFMAEHKQIAEQMWQRISELREPINAQMSNHYVY